MDELSCKQQVIDAGHELVEKGLIVRTWGNISCRIDQDRFAVTPSGMGYDRLTPNEIVVVNCRTLEHEGTIKPSGETGIHAAVYRLRPQAGFVIHTHQNAASAISLAGYDALSPTPEERTILGFSGSVPRAKYGLPCSKPLCKAVTGVLEGTDCTVLFMVRHGILSIGADREEAFRRAAVLEDMCRRALREEPAAKPMELELTPFIQAIQGANPSLTDILPCRESPVVRVSLEGKRLIPMLDDFAQLIGTEIACIDPARPEQAGRAIAGRNAVLIKGYGALCAARNREDAQAVEYLLTKECMSRINARQYGMGTPLPLVDRYIMRQIYVNKYSKLK